MTATILPARRSATASCSGMESRGPHAGQRDRLGVEAAVGGIIVLARGSRRTSGSRPSSCSARSYGTVRTIVKRGPQLRAVDERVAEAAVGRIEAARGGSRRTSRRRAGRARCRRAPRSRRSRSARRRAAASGSATTASMRASGGASACSAAAKASSERPSPSTSITTPPPSFSTKPGEAVPAGEPVNERPEADALDDAANPESATFPRHVPSLAAPCRRCNRGSPAAAIRTSPDVRSRDGCQGSSEEGKEPGRRDKRDRAGGARRAHRGARGAAASACSGRRVRDGAIVYDDLESARRPPIGWTDEQGPGRYRLERRDDEARFGYAVGPHSWKQFLLPPRVRLWQARRRGDGGFAVEEEPRDEHAARVHRRAPVRAARDRDPGSRVPRAAATSIATTPPGARTRSSSR